MRQLLGDPVIDEVREVRHRISAQVDHDPVRLVAYYMKLQEQYRDRLVEPPSSDNGAQPRGVTIDTVACLP